MHACLPFVCLWRLEGDVRLIGIRVTDGCVDAENWTWVFLKSRQCSQLLSYLSIALFIIIIIIFKSSSNNILYGTVSFWFQVCLKVFLGPRLLHWNSWIEETTVWWLRTASSGKVLADLSSWEDPVFQGRQLKGGSAPSGLEEPECWIWNKQLIENEGGSSERRKLESHALLLSRHFGNISDRA